MERKIYSFDEANKASLAYFKGDELAAKVWVSKYALKDSDGNIYEKTPTDMHRRLAKELSRIESKYKNPLTEDELFFLFDKFKYIIPQGSPMTGIGNEFQVASLSNCFVIGMDGTADSYGGIIRIDEEQVQLMKRRGGVGHDLSHIRPKGSPVKNSALTSTGLVPFMERYSNSTREVAQDGRRGALMLSVSIKHPDASDFIDAKMEQGKVTGANISVKIDDDFMKSVESGKPYIQQYPIESDNPSFSHEIDARSLWNKIVHNAWKSAEPGVLFWDTITRESVADCYAEQGFKTISTNPCGEIPICSYDSCRLLAINLYSYVIEPFTDNAKFDWPLFIEHVGYAMRIMDDIVDLEIEKVDVILTKIESDPESDEVKMVEKNLWLNIRKKAIEGRRTGLGITAEGDMLAALGFRYGTEDSNDFVEEVHKYIALYAYKESVELAKERGAFPLYDSKLEKNNPFIQRLKEYDPELYKNMLKHGRRNIQLLTVAPTGSVSIMSQTTSGIEPVFKPVYKRRKKINPNDLGGKIDFIDENDDTWEEYIVFHHHFETWMKIKGYDINKKYSAKELDELVKISPYYRATSEDVDWLMKVRMQGRVQKWVDHSISVTINLPSDVDEELVGQLYMEAWKSGCKGVTVYREGSRNGVLVSATSEDLNTTNKIEERPEAINCQVQRFMYGKDQWIAFVGLLNDAPYEIFTGINNLDVFPVPSNITEGLIIKVATDKGSRYDFRYEDEYGNINTVGGLNRVFNKEFWNYARLTSALMRRGTEPQGLVEIIDKLEFTNDTLNSWKSGVLRTLRAFIKDGTKSSKAVCTQCHKTGYLEYKEGCLTCMNCGNSNCS